MPLTETVFGSGALDGWDKDLGILLHADVMIHWGACSGYKRCSSGQSPNGSCGLNAKSTPSDAGAFYHFHCYNLSTRPNTKSDRPELMPMECRGLRSSLFLSSLKSQQPTHPNGFRSRPAERPRVPEDSQVREVSCDLREILMCVVRRWMRMLPKVFGCQISPLIHSRAPACTRHDLPKLPLFD